MRTETSSGSLSRPPESGVQRRQLRVSFPKICGSSARRAPEGSREHGRLGCRPFVGNPVFRRRKTESRTVRPGMPTLRNAGLGGVGGGFWDPRSISFSEAGRFFRRATKRCCTLDPANRLRAVRRPKRRFRCWKPSDKPCRRTVSAGVIRETEVVLLRSCRASAPSSFRQTFRCVRWLACRAAAIAFLPTHCLVSAILDRLLRRGVLRQESDQVELDFRRVPAMIAFDSPRQSGNRVCVSRPYDLLGAIPTSRRDCAHGSLRTLFRACAKDRQNRYSRHKSW